MRYYRFFMPGRTTRNDPKPIDASRKMRDVHPGEILLEEFLLPLEISQYRLAKSIHVPPRRINEIILGKRAVTADTALRLGFFFRNSARFWMNLQVEFDLRKEWNARGRKMAREIVSARHFA